MTDNKTVPRIFKCPGCATSIIYDVTNPNRPFCSASCKNKDIISWAEQSFKIPGNPPKDEKELSDLIEELEKSGELK